MSNSVVRQRVANASLLEYASKHREEGIFNDVTIVAENKSISANRLVLSCYSRYFEGMFKSRMKERYENIIEVKAIDGEILKALIDYIYNGSIVISNENVMSLLSGADYLQLKDVKQFCFEFLQHNISSDNALSIFKVATLYRNDVLKDEMQQYISEHLSQVSQTEDFRNLSKEEIISTITNLESFDQDKQAKATSTYQAIIAWVRHDQHRKNDLFELLKLVDIDSISLEFMEEHILDEELIEGNFQSQKLVMKAYRRQISRQKNKLQVLLSLAKHKSGHKVEIVFDLLNDSSVTSFDFPQVLINYCTMKLNDYVYFIGGETKKNDVSTTTNNVYRLNLLQPKSVWKPFASLNEKRSASAVAVYHDSLFVVGGFDQYDQMLASAEYYQTSLKKWFVSASLILERWGLAVVACDGCLYALGGCSIRKILSSVERLHDLNAKAWENVKPMLTSRFHLAAVKCGGKIYAIGGTGRSSGAVNEDTLKSVEKYDAVSNQWQYVSDMNIERHRHSACVLQGKIYVVGGYDKTDQNVKEIDCYDPETDEWKIVGNVNDELYNHYVMVL